ncbi:MAG: 4-(cytidine 5'-diphospho)-2-C-methyl-D-erythritol kinase [Bacteroidales bacterium]
MITFPKAKVNLGLRITSERPDGYHDIETLFYPVNLADALEFVTLNGKHDGDDLTVTGLRIACHPGNNIIIKTLQRMRKDFSIPFLKIHLHKAIPSGAGLGGGSSDAASAIKVINRHFDLLMNDEEMRSMALELGSDCPFFIDPVPSLATGRGEILQPVSPFLDGYFIVILNTGVSISTREAYINCNPAKPEAPLEKVIRLPIDKWKKNLKNDFEAYAFKIHPVLNDIKKALYRAGAFYSSLSGSGSSIFGIYKQKPGIPSKLKEYLLYEGIL